MLEQLKGNLVYRLLLALVAGCLATWFYMPEGFFQGPHDLLGWYLPGTTFGLLVLVPLVEHPIRYWRRSVVLLIAATIAHQAMWMTGFTMLAVTESLESVLSEKSLTVVLGAPSGLVFGIIVALATTRTLVIRFAPYNWVVVAVLSASGGTIFAGSILYQWEFFGEALGRPGTRVFNICLAYMALFLIYTIIFFFGKQQSRRQPARVDMVLLVGLILLAPLSWAWLAAIDMR